MEWLIRDVGHDGMAVWWRDKPPPDCYRGFHIQEIVDVCLKHDVKLVHIEGMPVSSHKEIWSRDECLNRFSNYTQRYNGIFIGKTHAVAWLEERVYDPRDGSIHDAFNMPIKEFWAAVV